MTITRTTAGPGLPTGFPFSLAVSGDSPCFISGMPALNPGGRYQPGSFEDEVALAWRNITTIARAAGYSTEEIVYVQCVIADIGEYGTLNAWWRSQFPDPATAGPIHLPGRSPPFRLQDRDSSGRRPWRLDAVAL